MFHRARPLATPAVGVLATVAVFGPAPGAAPQAKATLGPLQAVTLAGADFHPVNDAAEFNSDGSLVIGNGFQTARISFPAEVVVVTSVKVRVYDNDAEDLCAKLYRAVPADASAAYLGGTCTSGTSAQTPQTLTIPSVYARIGGFQTAFLWVTFGAAKSAGLALYGATVFYRVVS